MNKPRPRPAFVASTADDAEIDDALAYFADSLQPGSADTPDDDLQAGVFAGIACLDLPATSPPDVALDEPSSDTAFIGIAGALACEPCSSSRGQRDPPFHECYDDPNMWNAIDETNGEAVDLLDMPDFA